MSQMAATDPGEHSPSHGFGSLPSTKLGWWAVGVSGAFVVLFLLMTMVPYWLVMAGVMTRGVPSLGLITFAIGLVGFVLCLWAAIAKHERSWLLWLAMVPGLFAVLMVVGEFVFPH